MIKTTMTATAFAALLAAPVLAADMVTVEDTDGNGTYSMDELAVAFPGMTDELFAQVDVNADGAVDAEELAAAQEAGVLTAG